MKKPKAILKHNQPTIAFSLTVNVNVNADRFLLLLVGALWYSGQWLADVGRAALWVCGDVWQVWQEMSRPVRVWPVGIVGIG